MAGKAFALFRYVIARLRKYANNRRRVLRRGARFEVRLPFIITLLGAGKSFTKDLGDAPAVVGYTRDLSETGLTLLLPSVRIGGAYLTDLESYLGIKLELPGGPVSMLTASVRFEQLSQKEAGCAYLLAVRIIKMHEGERDRYLNYLGTAGGEGRRARERRQSANAPAGSAAKEQVSTWEAVTPLSVHQAYERFRRE